MWVGDLIRQEKAVTSLSIGRIAIRVCEDARDTEAGEGGHRKGSLVRQKFTSDEITSRTARIRIVTQVIGRVPYRYRMFFSTKSKSLSEPV